LITVSIGPPIEAAGRDAEELNAEVEQWIETEMRRISPERYAGPWIPERDTAPSRDVRNRPAAQTTRA
jgi:1-acyl-sn-glycerol-3-phosphate acyltransferase